MHSMTINWPLMVAKFVTLIAYIVNNLLSIQILSQCVLKILNIHIDIFLFQLVGMITRYNLTHEYMEHCLENLG